MNTLAGLEKRTHYGTTFFVNENEEIILKNCRECGFTKELEDFTINKGGKGGRHSKCKVCMNKYLADRGQAGLEHNKEWRRNNPDKVISSTHNWRAKNVGLPAELTADIVKQLRDEQQGRCILSGLEDNLHLEHAVPLSKGGGSTFDNCYFVNEYLNRAMKTTNMFEWIKGQLNFIQRRFYNVFVPMMADRNGMTPKEYEAYVYQCYEDAEMDVYDEATPLEYRTV